MFHIRVKPHPPYLAELGAMFSEQVEIETDDYWVPRGTWIRCSEALVGRLVEKLKHCKDDAQTQRVEYLLWSVQSVLDGTIPGS